MAQKKKSFYMLKLLNIAVIIVVFIVNSLANALPIGGVTTGEVSALTPNLFTPAGLTFSIWGLIYLLQVVFLITQYRLDNDSPWLEKIGYWYVILNLGNATWLIAWHNQIFWLSEIIMLVILVGLIMLYQRLGIGKKAYGPDEDNIKGGLFIPISVYFGWISVATIANTAALLTSIGWEGGAISEAAWAIIMIVIATVLGFILLVKKDDIYYTAVIVWALLGIAIKRLRADTTNPGIGYIAIAFMVLLIVAAIFLEVK